MDVEQLVRALSRDAAYPHGRDRFEVHHTHISVVFLAGPWAYKIKKQANLGFLDFSTLELREHFCRQEVLLNARRAPGVYRGVVPVTEGRWAEPGPEDAEPVPEDARGEGSLRFGGPGEPVEWAVKMERLPSDATLLARLRAGELVEGDLERVGRRVASFHEEAEGGAGVARYGDFEVVAGNARENIDQTRDHVGRTVGEEVHQGVEELLEDRLAGLEPLIRRRAAAGRPRDTHGDLHLDHIYLFRDRSAPRDLLAVDCIEFNDRFRYADPVADMAFLAMDLRYRGRPDLEEAFSRAYFEASGDEEGRALLRFYRSYRAAVRAKVEGFKALEAEVPAEQRSEAAAEAEAHWLLALTELADPADRPALVLVGGLPGVGKSTVALELAARAGLEVVSTDRVRKELAGVGPDADLRASFEEGVYTPEWTERTYQECLDRALRVLRRGGRVVVDGSFRSEAQRRRFVDAARERGVRYLLVLLEAPEGVARRRIEGRDREGGRGEPSAASDADWRVHREARRRWSPLGEETGRFAARVSAESAVEEVVEEVLCHLRASGMA